MTRGECIVEKDFIYVHLDSVSNSVLSKEINFSSYKNIVQQPLKNLLLLNATKDIGEYDSHTGFRVIRGAQKVEEFLDSEDYHIYIKKLGKWIDFQNLELLHELTPVEISELLYIAHAYTSLHSPFYYKLQNNFILLTLSEGFTKIYCRDLTLFYDFLAHEMTDKLNECINEKRILFKKQKKIAKIPVELTHELTPLLREGAALSFAKVTSRDTVSEIGVYLVEDRVRNLRSQMKESELMSLVLYDHKKQEWSIKELQPLAPSL